MRSAKIEISGWKISTKKSLINQSISINLSITCPKSNDLAIVELLCQIEFIVKYAVYYHLSSLAQLLIGWLTHSSRLTHAYHRTPSSITSCKLDLSLISGDSIVQTYSIDQPINQATFHTDYNPWGSADVISELKDQSPSCGLYLLNILPNQSIPLHVHHIMTEVEMCLSNQILCNESITQYGAVHEWGTRAHCYKNPLSDTELSILCIDCPVFIQSDEILVQPTDHPINQSTSESCYLAGHDTFHTIFNQSIKQSINLPSSISSIVFDGAYSTQSTNHLIDQPTNQSTTQSPNQACELILELSQQVSRGQAVLLFLFDSVGNLCFVHHRSRGYELIGGKVEVGETEIEAVIRETYEEANLQLVIDDSNHQQSIDQSNHQSNDVSTNSSHIQSTNQSVKVSNLTRIAQYRLVDGQTTNGTTKHSGDVHIKSVYIAQLASNQSTHESNGRPTNQSTDHSIVQSNFVHETSGVRWMSPPTFSSILASNNQSPNQSIDQSTNQSISQTKQPADQSFDDNVKFSILLCDHVYPLCLRVAQAAFGLL